MTAPTSLAPASFKPSAKLRANDSIRFAIGKSSLGSVLIAASPNGICALSLGDDDGLLKADLAQRFPNAELSEIDLSDDPTIARAFDFIENPDSEIDLELDLRGTDFQQLVWKALREIPHSQTSTYTEIASKIGRPKAVRAVAQACAANPVAVVVPCHRVLRRDGSLSGYRWGIERKEKLLKRENRAI